jgi:hypothetical protein
MKKMCVFVCVCVCVCETRKRESARARNIDTNTIVCVCVRACVFVSVCARASDLHTNTDSLRRNTARGCNRAIGALTPEQSGAMHIWRQQEPNSMACVCGIRRHVVRGVLDRPYFGPVWPARGVWLDDAPGCSFWCPVCSCAKLYCPRSNALLCGDGRGGRQRSFVSLN